MMWILFFMNLFVIMYVINVIAKLKANEDMG
ncbi:hypothetical protein SMWOGL2_30440 [Sporomusa malonica]